MFKEAEHRTSLNILSKNYLVVKTEVGKTEKKINQSPLLIDIFLQPFLHSYSYETKTKHNNLTLPMNPLLPLVVCLFACSLFGLKPKALSVPL